MNDSKIKFKWERGNMGTRYYPAVSRLASEVFKYAEWAIVLAVVEYGRAKTNNIFIDSLSLILLLLYMSSIALSCYKIGELPIADSWHPVWKWALFLASLIASLILSFSIFPLVDAIIESTH